MQIVAFTWPTFKPNFVSDDSYEFVTAIQDDQQIVVRHYGVKEIFTIANQCACLACNPTPNPLYDFRYQHCGHIKRSSVYLVYENNLYFYDYTIPDYA